MENNHGKIQLSGKNGEGKYALVDIDLIPYLEQYSWHLNKGGYAKSSIGLMHRVVISTIQNIPENHVVDHLNGDRLNNTFSNLKIKTYKGNAKNRTNDPLDGGYTGVTLLQNPADNNYKCPVKLKNNKYVYSWHKLYATVHRGYVFNTNSDPKMCALCYDSIVTYCYGEGKRINDRKFDKPLPVTYWKLSEELMKILNKFKSKHSDLKGVKKTKDGWKAFIIIELGIFDTDVEAHKAYQDAHKSYYGSNL
tara:strand:- start:51445 stop:52194 length:750 start_codon:yes stop_codon:yes gene_type:complete